MTFLYEKKIFNDLTKHLKKKAQVGANPIVVAKKLVADLDASLKDIPSISSETGAELKTSSLQNLDQLIKFLADNKIVFNGDRIVYAPGEIVPDIEKEKLAPKTTKISKDETTNKWNEIDYHINIDALIGYIHHLQEKAYYDNNQVLKVLVGKLIDQINTDVKSDSGLTRKLLQPTPEKPSSLEIADDVEIDRFGDKQFGPSLKNDTGPLILHAKDLKTLDAFHMWMKQSPTALVISHIKQQGQDTIKNLPYDNFQADKCVVIRSLYHRALNKKSEGSNIADFYLKKIQEIGSKLTDPDGKVCSISMQEMMISPSSTKDVKYTSYMTSANMSKEEVNTLEQVIESLPLDPGFIHFNKIRNFFNTYQPIAVKRANVIKLMQDAQVAMQKASNLTNTGMDDFNLGEDRETVITWLLPKEAINQYLPFISTLWSVLSNTAAVIEDIKAHYQTVLSPSQLQAIRFQIGFTPEEYSIYTRNKETLKRWANTSGLFKIK